MARDPEVLRAAVQTALVDARRAREQDDHDGRIAALEAAREAAAGIPDDPALYAAACWRLAKARYDAGRDDVLLDAVRPLLEGRRVARGAFGVKRVVGPFDDYEPGVQAVAPLAHRVADTQGYTDPTLRALWSAMADWARDRGEGFLHWWARAELGWIDAVTGEIDAVRELEGTVQALHPDDGVGQHTHPRAKDPRASIPWLQLDVARTRLRAEIWSGDRKGALDAMDAVLDAAAGLDLAPHHDPWVLDALVQGDLRWGLSDVTEAHHRHHAALATSAPLSDAHRARIRATHAADEALWAQAAEALHAERAGPEWVVDAWRRAGRAEEADAEAARTGVRITPR